MHANVLEFGGVARDGGGTLSFNAVAVRGRAELVFYST